jgi:DNA-binding transcriptional LysR family regulator
MLDEGLLDFVFGVAKVYKGPWNSTWLYGEPLLYIPRGTARPNGSRTRPVPLVDIADETFVMVPDACGLTRATRALFQSHRLELHQYSGEAMSYQVLEEWAALGVGAAILPKSKVAGGSRSAFPIVDKAGREVSIGFEAAWPRKGARSSHLLGFADHLRNVVPGIVSGLESGAKPRKRA